MTLKQAFEQYLTTNETSHIEEWRNAYHQAEESKLKKLCKEGKPFFRFLEILHGFQCALKVYINNDESGDYCRALRDIARLEKEVGQLQAENLKIKEAVATLLDVARNI